VDEGMQVTKVTSLDDFGEVGLRYFLRLRAWL